MFEVVEKFVSINGESVRAGEPAAFIRFKGCNLSCAYCDTKWANDGNAAVSLMTADEITEYADGTGVVNVTLTGGEPMLQSDIGVLVRKLLRRHSVEIETNGSVLLKELASCEPRPLFTLDYKLPGSGMESFMLTENYKYLRIGDAVKFVVGSVKDLERAKEIIDTYSLSKRCRVYISPVFGKIKLQTIAEFIINNKLNGVRFQLQLHKYIWTPETRGV